MLVAQSAVNLEFPAAILRSQSSSPFFSDCATSLPLEKPELRIEVDEASQLAMVENLSDLEFH